MKKIILFLEEHAFRRNMEWQIIIVSTFFYLIILLYISLIEIPPLFADINNLNKMEGHTQYADFESGGSALNLHLMNDNTIYVVSSNFNEYWERITRAADNYRPIEIYYSGYHYSRIYPLEIRSDGKILLPLEAQKSLSRGYLNFLIVISLLYFLMMRKMIRQLIRKRRQRNEKRKQRTTILG